MLLYDDDDDGHDTHTCATDTHTHLLSVTIYDDDICLSKKNFLFFFYLITKKKINKKIKWTWPLDDWLIQPKIFFLLFSIRLDKTISGTNTGANKNFKFWKFDIHTMHEK